MADPDIETRGWLRLARCPGLSARDAADLGRACGGTAFADGAPPPPVDHPRLDPALRAALADAGLGAQVEAEVRRAAGAGWTLLPLADPRYPPNLARLPAPPPVLTVQGDPAALAGPAAAIVGSRYPSGYGLRLAEELGAGLARMGVVVVSGMARGIDAAAHRAALAAGGATVAVMGTGMDVVYPRHHGPLARSIAVQGALATEFPPGAPPLAAHFPQRNRVIAGLADAVVVVEARARSGALITTRYATDFFRPVLAVPGRSGDPLAEGPIALLRDGAALACCAGDVLLELPPDRKPPGLDGVLAEREREAGVPLAAPGGPGDPVTDDLLRRLPRDDEVTLDDLLEETKHPPEDVLAALFSLELAGLVDALPGGAYRRARPRSAKGAV